MIIIAAAITGLSIYIMGFYVGKKYAESEIRSTREEMGADNENDRV